MFRMKYLYSSLFLEDTWMVGVCRFSKLGLVSDIEVLVGSEGEYEVD